MNSIATNKMQKMSKWILMQRFVTTDRDFMYNEQSRVLSLRKKENEKAYFLCESVDFSFFYIFM